MKKPKAHKVAVIGDGAWGTATALVLHRKGAQTAIWGAFPDYVEEVDRTRENTRFLPGVPLPADWVYTADLAEAAASAELIVQAVPTQHLRRVFTDLAPHVPPGVPVVSLSKGIEGGTLARPDEIIKGLLGRRNPVVVLSGPSHAEEVARRLPTSLVAASKNEAARRHVQAAFSDESVRVYTSSDVAGVSLGGALKNVIAIAAGISDGLGFGDNTKAALITRGAKEMSRLGTALGGRAGTFAGLSGIGDLIVTCVSPHGRNRAFGEALGRGQTLKQVLAATQKVVEGVWTSRTLGKLARDRGVEIPISREVYRILFRGRDVRRAVVELMTRSLKAE
jgi:glycerol-3-phosphate dehydrogenase (NAD(P)+)